MPLKFPSIHSISPLEVVLFAVFVLYLIFPVPTPPFLIEYINSNISIALIIILTLYMLFYTTPVLAILTVFVAYELLRRSHNEMVTKGVIRHTPTQWKKDEEMRKMNPAAVTTLEEEVISVMAPVGKSELNLYVSNTSSFKPAQDKIAGASMIS